MESIIKKLALLGNEWKKAGASRFYFNDLERAYGLKFESDSKTGKVTGVYLDGETITTAQGLKLRGKLALAQVWFDTGKGTFHYKDLDKVMANEIIDNLRKEISQIQTFGITDGFVPDYSRKCDNCSQSPVVTLYKKGKMTTNFETCGPCTFGESVNVGTIGHIDHGKTTLSAAILAAAKKFDGFGLVDNFRFIKSPPKLCRQEAFTGRRSKGDRKRNPKWRRK